MNSYSYVATTEQTLLVYYSVVYWQIWNCGTARKTFYTPFPSFLSPPLPFFSPLLSPSFLSPRLPFSPLLSPTLLFAPLSGGNNFNDFPNNQLTIDFAFLASLIGGALLHHRLQFSQIWSDVVTAETPYYRSRDNTLSNNTDRERHVIYTYVVVLHIIRTPLPHTKIIIQKR